MSKYIKLFDAAADSFQLKSNAIKVTTDAAMLADTTTAQTFTNKTLTAPVITNAVSTASFLSLAGTGTTVANAALITIPNGTVFATAADGTVGVLLPVASTGAIIHLKNDDVANAVLKVYAQVNSTINAISANSALSMAAKTSAVFCARSATAWFTIPLLPS